MTDWTTPRTWVISEMVTKAILDAHVRDNMLFLAENPMMNLLTNGGFEVWQRGAGAFTAHNAYTADRWQISLAGSSTLSVSRDTANRDTNSQYDAACTYVHNTSSYLTQKIEDYFQFRGKKVSLSLRVKTSTASAVRLQLDDGATVTHSSYHTGGGAYETLRIENVAIGASVTQVLFNIRFDASATVYVDNAMLVIGPEGPDYQPLHPADDLARCLRYYETHGGVNASIYCAGYNAAGEESAWPFIFQQPKGGTPTVTKNGTWTATNCAQPAVSGANVAGYSLSTSVTATAAMNFLPNSSDDTVSSEYNP